MRTAHPRGLSPDGKTLIVVIEGGEEVAIPADERLRAALRNDRARIGQLEIDMESALRPRDIQARIRAGESLEAVAQAAGVPVAKIEPFAGPVLAEREHVAGLAQTNPVRRTGDAVAHRSLRNVVADRLLPQGVDPDDVDWDAWRTEDRRWTVRLSYQVDSTEHQAEFSYDQTGRFSTAGNDDARWLTGELSGAEEAQPEHDGAGSDHNDELAIVRAIQPQFAGTPDLDDDSDEESLDDASSDSEDAFAEGDLTEVNGVYDIVPGDGSNMDVLYDMLSTFDEDSVQIYAGLVRPRPEQSAAPVLHDGPATIEVLTDEIEVEITLDDPAQGQVDDALEGKPASPADDVDAEPIAPPVEPDPEPAAPPVEPEPEPAAPPVEPDPEPAAPPVEPEPEPAAPPVEPEPEPAAPPVEPEPESATPPIELVETPPSAKPEPATAPGETPPAPDAQEAAQPTVDRDEIAAAAETTGAEESTPAARPGRIKPSPTEPEQPSLVDAAGNEPSRSIKRKRASVPSWDEIMFGAPRPKE